MENIIERIQITADFLITDALKRIDETRHRILFVCDKNQRLIGALTDGDIRRKILKDGMTTGNIAECFNPHPVFVIQGECTTEEVKALMLEKTLEAIPMVNKNKEICDVLFWDDIFSGKVISRGKVNVPIVIMAGGKGTRLDPFTKVLPKPLIPVGEKPIVEVIIDQFHQNGAADFYLTINYKGDMIKAYFDGIQKDYRMNYILENEFLGTAGSLRLLPDDFHEVFIVSNCDILVNMDYSDLVDFHITNNNLLTVVGSIQHYRIPYGVIQFEEEGKCKGIQEKPEFDFMVNTGAYVVSKEALSYIPENQAFDMTDLFSVLVENNQNIGVYPVSQKSYVDIGQWDEYQKYADNLAEDGGVHEPKIRHR